MDAQEKSFTSVLDDLLDGPDVSIPQLFRFSDMAFDEMAELETRWPTASAERRAAISQHLADISEENFEVEFSPAFGMMLNDESADVRRAALDGLWDSDNVRLVRPIITLMQSDPNVLVRKTAARTLAHFVLMGVWGQISARVKDTAVDALLETYQNPETDVLVRSAALEAMGSADHPQIPTLILEGYEADEREIQASAIFAMGVSADPRWLNTILDEMESPYEEMRLEAVRASGEIGKSDAVSPLSQIVYDDVYEIREAAIFSLGKIGSEVAQGVLNELLEDEDVADLHEIIEEVINDSEWSSGDFDFDKLNFDLD